MKRLSRKKLDFRHREAAKRQHSFKGRDRDPLFAAGEERDKFDEVMARRQEKRAKSRELDQKDRVRAVPREFMTDFDQGAPKRGSALSVLSDAHQDSQQREKEDEELAKQRAREAAAQEGALQGGEGAVLGALDAASKTQFIGEIRTDMKPMITQIALEQSEKVVRPVRQ